MGLPRGPWGTKLSRDQPKPPNKKKSLEDSCGPGLRYPGSHGHKTSEGATTKKKNNIWRTPVAQGSVPQRQRGHKNLTGSKKNRKIISGGLLWPRGPLPRGPGSTKPRREQKTKNNK